MASIPLFTGVADLGGGLAGVRPDTDQIARLDPRLYGQGASDARFAPSTAGAIANAATQGVETYQRTTLNNQAIQQNEAQLAREPQRAQLEEAKLQEAQAQLAEETKLRQRRDELMGVLRAGTPQQKAQAVVSGTFADVFARDPRLEDYAIKVAAPGMTDEEADTFVYAKQLGAQRAYNQKNIQKFQSDYIENAANLSANSDINQIFTRNPDLGYNLDRLLDRTELRRDGEFKMQPDGKTPLRVNGQLVRNPEFGAEGEKIRYSLVDKKTGVVMYPNVSPDTQKLIESRASLKAQIAIAGQSDEYSRAINTLRASRGQRVLPDLSPRTESQKQPQAQPQAGNQNLQKVMTPAQAPAGKPVEEPPVTKRALTTTDFQTAAKSAPIEFDGGRISFQKSPEYTQLASQTLGISPELAAKHTDALARTMDEGFPQHTGTSFEESNRIRQNAKFVREDFAKTILAADYQTKKKGLASLGLYTPEAVAKHNADVDTMIRMVRAGAGFSDDDPIPPDFSLGELRGKVNSPEELYIQDNAARIEDQLNILHTTAMKESRQRAVANMKKGTTGTRVAAITASFVGGSQRQQ